MQLYRGPFEGEIKFKTNSVEIYLYRGKAYLESYFNILNKNGAERDVLIFNPEKCEIKVDGYSLNKSGTVLISKGIKPHVEIKNLKDCFAISADLPEWWSRYTGESHNSTGYEGNEEIGIYKLSDRRDFFTNEPTTWTNDSVSKKPDNAYGFISLSYVIPVKKFNLKYKDEMIPIYENRPYENIHRHPDVRRYEHGSQIRGLTEIYIVTKGKLGVGLFNKYDNKLSYYLLAEGDVLQIEPGEIHAILCTSKDFAYVCVQIPSCCHFPYHHNKHKFSDVYEMSNRLGYDIFEKITQITELGLYNFRIDCKVLEIC